MDQDLQIDAGKISYRKIMAQADFSKFFFSQVLVSVGDGFFGVLVTFLALAMGASVTTLGVVAFCVTFPRGVLGIIGGAFADQYDRRRLMMLCDLVRGLGVLTIALLVFTDHLNITWLTILGSVVMTTYAISKPASKAFVPAIVSRDELVLANGLVQSVLWPCFFLGAGLVGILSAADIAPVYALVTCAVVFCLSQLCLARIKARPSTGASDKNLSSIVSQLRAGLDELQAHRALMVRVSTYFFYTISWRGTIQIALPLYVINNLQQPAAFYSSLMVACGVGELVSSLVIGKLRVSSNLKLAYLGESVLALALLILAFNYVHGAPALLLTMLACVLIGLSATIIDIPLVTAIQTEIGDDKVGKIFSYWSALGALGGSVGTLMVSGLIYFLSLHYAILLMLLWLLASSYFAYRIAYDED